MNEALTFLLRLAVGTASVDDAPQIDAACWKQIYKECCRQAIVGVVGGAVGMLPKDNHPPTALWMQWVANVAAIEQRNRQITDEIQRLSARLAEVGLTMQVLKGQSVARYYREPSLRQPGDIDAWITGGYDSLSELYGKLNSLGEGILDKPTYHHAEWHTRLVPVEVHYRPSFFFNPLYNLRFQQWAQQQDVGIAFDRVYLLVHAFRHVVSEGIGLRQMMDYACLLDRYPIGGNERTETLQVLEQLGLTQFAASVMYVMQRVFGVADEHLLMPPDIKRGRHILKEIMLAGNFGQYDARIDIRQLSSEGGSFYLHTRRRLRFLTSYPSELLFDIPFRLWHFFWRKRHACLIKQS